ncbi:MAG TPA: LysE family translocator [Steroidobacteraceae bacterium]|jgi:threonine/homoserine/homoserine lactone efflux protein|nr:LysE family translocator [Steroidobacteraceae bacterium]
MLGIHDYWLFIVSGVLLNLTPGQDTMYILGRSLTGGLRCGVASALGIATGSIIHTLAAAAGLSVLLATSPVAFTAVKLCGGAYLIYLGGRLFFTRHPANATGDLQSDAPLGSAWLAFGQGVLTNVLNPKVALFFLALLPQFISPASPSKTLAFLALGATFITTGTIWCLILAVGAARLRSFFARNPNVRTLIDRASGGLFMLLGTRLAWSR